MDFIETVDFTIDWYINFYETKENIYDYTIKQIEIYTNKAVEREIAWAIN